MLKKDIRNVFREKRTTLSFREREKFQDLLLIQFQRLNIDIPSVILTYAPFENEYDPEPVVRYCRFKNAEQHLAYPIVREKDCLMDAILVNADTDFRLNRLGIAEPVNGKELSPDEIDMVILPLLAFDRNGNRVGYGKGYYDRFLKKCRKDVLKIGFSFFDGIDKITDTDSFDVPMDCCITPFKIYHFES